MDAEAEAEDRTTVPELVLEELEIRATAEVIPEMLAVLLAVVVWAGLAETLQMGEMLQTAAAVLIFMVRCMQRAVAAALILKVLVAAVTGAAGLVELIVITVVLVEETLEAEAGVVDAAARRAVRVVQAE